MYDTRNPNIPAASANIAHSVSQMIGDSEIFVAGSGFAANYARINLNNGANIGGAPGAHTNKFSIAGDDKHVSDVTFPIVFKSEVLIWRSDLYRRFWRNWSILFGNKYCCKNAKGSHRQHS